MPTIQNLEHAGLRIVRDDQGNLTKIIDAEGDDLGFVSGKRDPVCTRIKTESPASQF